MTNPRKWQAGVADEVWKIHICSRDISRAEEIASALAYIISQNPGGSFAENLQAIENFSGAQIAAMLRDCREKSMESIKAAFHKD